MLQNINLLQYIVTRTITFMPPDALDKILIDLPGIESNHKRCTALFMPLTEL